MADRHLSKRQYQPQITSFFHSSSSDSPYGTSAFQRNQHVDQETQSSLLSLGMRIRKAVPEGYKTHKTFPPIQYQQSVRRQHIQTINRSATRELTPLCGLFKIGGLSAPHELGTADEFDMGYQNAEEELGMWNGSSQESNFSVQSDGDVRSLDSAFFFGGPVGGAAGPASSSTGSNKRRLEYPDSEGDADNEEEEEIPGFLMASPGKAFPGRVFARPRRRAASNLRESMNAISMTDSVRDFDFDFEEASFLKGDWNGDVDGEIEMGM